MSGPQLECFPKKRPTRVVLWWLNDDGSRVKLYEHRGLGPQLALGTMLLEGLIGTVPRVPPPARRRKVKVRVTVTNLTDKPNRVQLKLGPASPADVLEGKAVLLQ